MIALRSLLLLCLWVTSAVAQKDPDDIPDDIPDILAREDIGYFFKLGFEDMFDVLHFLFEQGQRVPSQEEEAEKGEDSIQTKAYQNPLPEVLQARGSGNLFTTPEKLKLDLEQANYLAETLKDETEQQFFRDVAAPAYQAVLDDMKLTSLTSENLYYFTHADYHERNMDMVYGKAWRPTLVDALVDEKTGEPVSLLNPLNEKEIVQTWNNGEGIVILDDFLTEQALATIQKLLWESTVWFQAPPKGATAGAFLDDGLYDKLLIQLAYQVFAALPESVLPQEENTLHDMFARKYVDNDKPKVVMQETYYGYDRATVEPPLIEVGNPFSHLQLILWLAPDEQVDGNLTIFTEKPPQIWQTEWGPTGNEVIEYVLSPLWEHESVPFRQNRAVLFDAALFHQFSHFKPPSNQTYENHRMDLSLIYGMKVHDPADDDLDSFMEDEF